MCAKVLLEDGFDVVVYEKYTEIGGIWAPGGCYHGLHNQAAEGMFQFADLPNKLYMASAVDTQRYLLRYAEQFGVLPKIRFTTEVTGVRRDGTGWQVESRPAGDGQAERQIERFDYLVIASGAHHQAHIPNIKGRDRFTGLVLHSNEMLDTSSIEGKKVVVVGGGKSALDMSILAAEHGSAATLVQRKVNWFVPERIVGGLVSYKYVLMSRFGKSLLPTYYDPSCVRTIDRMPAVLKKLLWRVIGWDLLFSGGLHRLPKELLPKENLPYALAHTGVMPRKYPRYIRQGKLASKVATVEAYTETGVRLSTGEEIAADVVIFATGHRKVLPFLDPSLQFHDRTGRVRLHRGIAYPGHPTIAFLGFRQIFNNPLSLEISSHWISSYFLGRLVTLPTPEQMQQEIDHRLEWQEQVIPKSMGYDYGPYDVHCVDELMHEMGLPSLRTNNVFSEYLAPAAMATRYAGLTEERRQRHMASVPTRRTTAAPVYVGLAHLVTALMIAGLAISYLAF